MYINIIKYIIYIICIYIYVYMCIHIYIYTHIIQLQDANWGWLQYCGPFIIQCIQHHLKSNSKTTGTKFWSIMIFDYLIEQVT
jgi:hypothetical protein